jgi:choline dehydrogenase-like flavoprotein
MAVGDPALRVHRIAGRRVADAAIMPAVVADTPNAATIRIGEGVADRGREPLRLAA